MRSCSLISLCLVLASWIWGQSPYQEAEASYQAGDFARAAELYQTLVTNYGGTADLYYNLGIARLGTGDKAGARWALEKANRLRPGSYKIKNALGQINQSIEPRIEANRHFILLYWLSIIRDIFSVHSWAYVVLFLTTITCLERIARIWYQTAIDRRIIYFLWSITLAAIGFYFAQYYQNQTLTAVLLHESPLFIAPEAGSQELLPLGAGTKIDILDSLQSWYKVVLENNDQGWLPKAELRRI
jgi:hypothetical protein